MRVLVCGGRDYADARRVERAMRTLLHHASPERLVVIQGGAPGADRLAQDWAKATCGAETVTVRADWLRHGRAAGPMRNQRMLDEQAPELVVAFPGGRGTADMVRRARAAGVKVWEVRP